MYVEEKDMPKDYKTTCKNCPFRGDEGLGCEERRMFDKDFICPLQPLSDHTKQVRKEVCEALSDEIEFSWGIHKKNHNNTYKIYFEKLL